MTDKPPFDIDLSPSRVLCSFHPLPWKDTWREPSTITDVIQFCIELFNVVVADDDIINKCILPGQDKASVSLLNKLLPTPICCWVGTKYPIKLAEIYKDLNVEPPRFDLSHGEFL